MPISPYIRAMREHVGHDLLLIPSVAVLPWDDEGRILLVRQSDDGRWGTIGGAVEIDEDPRDSAVREAQEEAGVDVELTGIRDVLGGPGFRRTYPNGDETAYVSTVFDARVVGGEPRPDHDETTEVRWFSRADLGAPDLDLGNFARLSLTQAGLMDDPSAPLMDAPSAPLMDAPSAPLMDDPSAPLMDAPSAPGADGGPR